tara:strand:- start:3605 stop:4057 length:453 start_codon:yes stop_codon:yes gene_type:complete
MFTTKRGSIMAKEIRYTYSGKEVGTLRKLVSDVVVLEESWLAAADKFFAESGYQHFLKYAKALIRQECSDDLTDAQAWMLIHHITNTGVPLALRDESADEKSAPAKVMTGVAGAVLGVGDAVIGTSAKLVQPMIPSKNNDDDSETQDSDE